MIVSLLKLLSNIILGDNQATPVGLTVEVIKRKVNIISIQCS